jgi:protein phosphatase 1 regulatory subunit 36
VSYGVVLLKYSSKFSKRDQFFFETLIYLVGKVMRSFFSREEFLTIEEEIDRLFRSEKYNIIKKRHENDQILRQFPILKDQQKANKVNISAVLAQAEEKSAALRELTKVKKRQREQRKTISVSGPEVEDKDKRSPILSVYLPSNRVRMVTFTR